MNSSKSQDKLVYFACKGARSVFICLPLLAELENSYTVYRIQVGLPAKSGVSGVMIVVIPNVMGMCLFSPRLDKTGNSSRGVAFCKLRHSCLIHTCKYIYIRSFSWLLCEGKNSSSQGIFYLKLTFNGSCFQKLVDTFSFHNYDSMINADSKKVSNT